MTRTEHAHGTHSRYALGSAGEPPCRCTPCKAAHAAYQKWRYKQHVYGRPLRVTADPVRRHVATLRAAGLGRRRIAELAGLGDSTITDLIRGKRGEGPNATVHRNTARKIMAVTVEQAAAVGVPVDAVGTRRRLQALVAVGWSQRQLAHRLGREPTNLTRTVIGVGAVSTGTAAEVRELYAQLWDQQPPPSTAVKRSKNRAKANGWAPPMAWDDDSIDDPDARPDFGEDTPRGGVDIAEAAHLAAGGAKIAEIARRLGVTVRSIERAKERQTLK